MPIDVAERPPPAATHRISGWSEQDRLDPVSAKRWSREADTNRATYGTGCRMIRKSAT
jgi:hypothetical protein